MKNTKYNPVARSYQNGILLYYKSTTLWKKHTKHNVAALKMCPKGHCVQESKVVRCKSKTKESE